MFLASTSSRRRWSSSGQEQKIQITGSSGLKDDEISQMIKEAEAHADEDHRLRELVDARNNAENLVYSTEKSLKDMGDKVDAETKSGIETGIADLKKAMEGDDTGDIRAKTDALMTASHKLAEAVYQQTQASQAAGGEGSSGSAETEEDEVVEDADYEIIDDDKK